MKKSFILGMAAGAALTVVLLLGSGAWYEYRQYMPNVDWRGEARQYGAWETVTTVKYGNSDLLIQRKPRLLP